jgi:hypothetical protein
VEEEWKLYLWLTTTLRGVHNYSRSVEEAFINQPQLFKKNGRRVTSTVW